MTTLEPIVISYSELDSFRQCPLKHLLGYGQRWTKPVPAGDRRSRGTLWHTVLESHYGVLQQHPTRHRLSDKDKRALLGQARAAASAHWLVRTDDEDLRDSLELIEWMYSGYVERYGLDEQWQIQAIEARMIEPLTDRSGRRTRYHLKAKMDLIVRDLSNGGLWIVDHKSMADLPTTQSLEIDDQFGLYQWILRQRAKRGLNPPPRGSLHSASRTKRNQGDYATIPPTARSKPQTLDQRFARHWLNRSDAELTNVALDAYNTARAAYSGGRPIYSAPNPQQCGWRCDFKEVHLAIRTGVPMARALPEFGFVQDFTRH